MKITQPIARTQNQGQVEAPPSREGGVGVSAGEAPAEAPVFALLMRAIAQISPERTPESPVTPGRPGAEPARDEARPQGRRPAERAGRAEGGESPAGGAACEMEVDDVAARELRTATERGPDPLGLGQAVKEEAVAVTPAGERKEVARAASPEKRVPEERANAGESGRSASNPRGEAQNSGADAAPAAEARVSQNRPDPAAPSEAKQVAAAGRVDGAPGASARGVLGPLMAAGAARGAEVSARSGNTGGVQGIGGIAPGTKREGFVVRRLETAQGAARPERSAEPAALQATRAIAAALKAGERSVRLRMTPEHLGEVRVELMVNEGKVSASFRAATEVARDLLAESSDVLRLALEARGLRVESMEFAVTEHGGAQAYAEHWSGGDPGGAGSGGGGAAGEGAARSAPGGSRSGPEPSQDGAASDASVSVVALGVDAVA